MSSNRIITVGAALLQLQQLDGQMVQVEGVLEIERDGVALKVDSFPAQSSYIRLLAGHVPVALFRSLISHLKHKRVQVIGLMHIVDARATAERRHQPRAGLDTLVIVSL